jgi:excisionase family DNA binding protein
MAQGYYTLTEAAKFLNMPVDELKQMAQKGQIRSFQDRGTLRFRIQDIQELARKRGVSTDPELVLGDASLPAAKSSAAPRSGIKKKAPTSPKTPAKAEGAPEVFDFDFDESVDVGANLPGPSSGSKSKHSPKSKRPSTPKIGSDSDVRLVADGSDVTFSIPKEPSAAKPTDSDVKISPDPLKPKTGIHGASSGKRPSQLALGSGAKAKDSSALKHSSPRPSSGSRPLDSGVRLVPLDDDSDVKLLGASDDVPLGEPGESSGSDSNVRLEKVELPPADSGEGDMHLTEEINLDEELLQQQEKEKDKPSTKLKAKSELKLPSTSPFELSDSDLELPSELKEGGAKTPVKAKADPADSSDFDLAAQGAKKDDSSDFDLAPAADAGSHLDSDSSDFSLEVSDDEQAIHDDGNTELTSATSGLTLNNPADEGISLEEGQDSSDFDLSLEPEDTPRPKASRPVEDSDSEFELKADKTPKPKKKTKPVEEAGDSSEFELSLDSDADSPLVSESPSDDSSFEINLEGSGEGAAGGDSSEFELTLDDSGNIAAADDEAAPQVKSRKKKDDSSEEQDIFDTDFEVPALDESDDANVADSELESSDFDLALDDSDLAAEDESGSQVVALDDEDAETVADDDAAVADDVDVDEESSDFQDLDEDVEVEDVDGEDVEVETESSKVRVKRETIVQEKLVPAAQWGILPVIFMLPCVIVMVLVGMLGYEMVQSSNGLKPPGPLTVGIAEQIGMPVGLKK